MCVCSVPVCCVCVCIDRKSSVQAAAVNSREDRENPKSVCRE